ncbi:MAG: dihydroxyacetone kinase phosphoryl donor subunit DhaM, partial [Actinomycetota bacterium]
MVGIVVVSHSRSIAEGAADLARQMAGEDVRIEATGGLDEPGDPIGTDAMLVLAAIERAWSDDGVLVLMDLGSAVLSTEMALDFLDEERRTKVRLTGAPVIEGAVAAAVAAKIGGTLDDVEREAMGGLAGKASHLGVGSGAADGGAPAAASEVDGPEERIEITVDLPHGLHARPAARFVQTVSGFDAATTVRNVTAGRGPVSARSLNAVATLGVTVGQSIEVVARGAQAPDVVKALRALAERSFDEEAESAVDAEPAGREATVLTDGVVRGVGASPGFAVAPARRFHTAQLPSPSGTP